MTTTTTTEYRCGGPVRTFWLSDRLTRAQALEVCRRFEQLVEGWARGEHGRDWDSVPTVTRHGDLPGHTVKLRGCDGWHRWGDSVLRSIAREVRNGAETS